MPRLLIIILAFNCICSCTESTPNYSELENEINQTFDELNLITACEINTDTSDMYLNIFFEKNQRDTSNSFFLDEESNLVLVSLLNFEFYESFEGFDTVHYSLSFEGYLESDFMAYPKLERKKHFDEFTSYPKFLENTRYAIKNMRYMGVMQTRRMMVFLKEQVPVFNYEGTFWKFLYDFSILCDDPSVNLWSAFQFIWFTGITNDEEFKNDADLFPEHLKFIVSNCGYPDSLVNEKFKDPAILLDDLKKLYETDPK
jgi:hypothetical protein